MVTAYCTVDFLDNLFQHSSIDSFDQDFSFERSKVDVKDLLLNGSIVKVNQSAEEIEQKFGNPFFKTLMRKGRLKSAEKEFFNFNSDPDQFFQELNERITILLTDDFKAEQIHSLQQSYGVHCLSHETGFSSIFEEKIQTFRKGQESVDWQFSIPFFFPHHSIVVADPYLFNVETLNSLIDLFAASTPKKLKRRYHVTLIGKSRGPGIKWEETKIQKTIVGKIPEIMSALPPASTIEYHFYNRDDFHDRYIITNNTCIFSGYGLDIIKQDLSKKEGTWIALKPFKRMSVNGNSGAFFVKAMQNKLNVMLGWILDSNVPKSSNPLFD